MISHSDIKPKNKFFMGITKFHSHFSDCSPYIFIWKLQGIISTDDSTVVIYN